MKYIVVNEPRSGSSWLQEMSQMHPGIKAQFELDAYYGDSALECKQCFRPRVPNSKNPSRSPPKLHPPLACGMSIFGSSNNPEEIGSLAERHGAALIILLRVNHVAQAISSHLHFTREASSSVAAGRQHAPPRFPPEGPSNNATLIHWTARDLIANVRKMTDGYEKLLHFPARSSAAGGRPAPSPARTHIIFYEDLKRDPAGAWRGVEAFLGLPPTLSGPGDLSTLEPKSTTKPSIYYLADLPALQAHPLVSAAAAADAAAATTTAAADAARWPAAGHPTRADGTSGAGGGQPSPPSARGAGPAAPGWLEMLRDAEYDTHVDLAGVFAGLCARFPGARMAWRLAYCADGAAVPLFAAAGAPEPSVIY